MIIESAVEAAIPRLMQKDDCEKLREEEISSLLAKGSELVLSDLGVPNHTKFVQVEKLYPENNNSNGIRADIFIDKDAIVNFGIQTSELYHHIWIECKYLRHSVASWDIKKLITDIRKLLNNGDGLAYLIVLMHSKLEDHNQENQNLIDIQNVLLSMDKKSVESLFEIKENIEKDEDLPGIENSEGYSEVKLRRNFSDVFPLKFGSDTRYYNFVTLKIFSQNLTKQGYDFDGV